MEDVQTGILHAYHQDEQGSTAYITGSDGATENCYIYDAFGNVLESQDNVRNRILYTGQQYGQETGQYYLRARYYNPVVGRFTQEDTYRGDGLNLYAYCGNNPVMYYDPSGHQKAVTPCGDGTNNELGTTQGNRAEIGANNELEVAQGNKAKTGPKPKGTGAHNEKIEEIGNQITDGKVIAGGGKLPEKKISTPGGKKSSRRPDILVERPDGSQYGINVGRTTVNGAPVKREVEAIYDLEDSGLPMYFVGYDR